ncbi:hypothetical protein D3C85_790270 [compost metagenome]
MLSILGKDAAFIQCADALFAPVQGHVGAAQRRVQGAGQNHPLAANGVVRGELASQSGVRHLSLKVLECLLLHQAQRGP